MKIITLGQAVQSNLDAWEQHYKTDCLKKDCPLKGCMYSDNYILRDLLDNLPTCED